jgi:repressor LexA
MKPLTARQQEILVFLAWHHEERGFWPSIRDIQAKFGFRSTNAVIGHLRALEAKGHLERTPGYARAFRLKDTTGADLPEGASEVVELPVYGAIAAGYPDGVEQGNALGRVQVDVDSGRRRSGSRPFALRVRGESMIDAGIYDGDTVIVEPRQPKLGDIVVALLDGQSTLKRLAQGSGRGPVLKSENKDYPNLLPLEELVVQGVAVSVIRRL